MPVGAAKQPFAWALALAAAVVAVALLPSGPADPATARAASCTVASVTTSGDTITVQGGSCKDNSEGFAFDCIGGVIRFDYILFDPPPVAVDPETTGVACGAQIRLVVEGNGGDDVIDLRRVTPASGFSGMAGKQNAVRGGIGDDTLIGSSFFDAYDGGADDDRVFARDAHADSIECGTGADLAEADQPSIDPVSACEAVDALPEAKAKCRKSKGKKRAASAKRCKRKKK